MEKMRCSWGNSKNPLYQEYHDNEWGKLNLDSTYLYEMLVLESFQSGLSWETILNKRENFRKVFANFDYHEVAKFNEDDFERLMQDKGIVRNRLKINAAINNAKVLVKLENNNQTFKQILTKFIPRPISPININYRIRIPKPVRSHEPCIQIGKRVTGSPFCP